MIAPSPFFVSYLTAGRRTRPQSRSGDTGIPMPSSGVWNTMKVAVWPVFIWLIRLSSITTSATQPVARQRTKPARPISVWSILRPEARRQQNTKRRDDAQEAAFAVRSFQHDYDERDVGPVLGRHVLHEGALLGRGARRRLAAHLPVAEGVLDHALSAGAAGSEQGRKPQQCRRTRTEPTVICPSGISVCESLHEPQGGGRQPHRSIFGPLGPWQGRRCQARGTVCGDRNAFWPL